MRKITRTAVSTLLLLIAASCLSTVARAALTHITGTIQFPDGSYPSGTMTITSQAFINASGVSIPAVNLRNLPIISGAVDISLEPNVGATPAGTSYRVTYNLSGAPVYQRVWYVPASPSAQLSQVEFPVPGLVGTSAVINPVQIQGTGAQVGYCISWNGNFATWSSSCGSGGSPLFSNILTGTNNSGQTMTVGSTSALTYSGTGIVNASQVIGTAISSLYGNSGKLLQGTGTFTNGHVLSIDASGNGVDSGVVAANVLVSTGAYANPSWLTSLAGSKITGTVACAQQPALTGDVTTIAGACTSTVSTIGGLAPAPSATIDTTNAANISTGTLNANRLPVINLASSGAGGVNGNLQIANFNNGTNASSTTVWYGDGTWKSIAAGGTVTNTAGPLAPGGLVIGNGGNDVKVLGALGTSTTVLHGNSGGNPSFGAVVLTTDVSGILPAANGGLGTASIAFSGPSGAAKTFGLPNASANILTDNAAVTLAQGGTGANLSTIAKGGLITGTGAGTVGITTVGADGLVLSADSTQPGGVKWISAAGSGTVTSIATTGPITGGTITATGTIACPTCVTSAAALTANQLLIGAGSQGSAALGTLGTVHQVLHGNNAGAPSFGAVDLTTEVTGVLPTANGGFGTTASAQLQYLRTKPNSGNTTTLEFAALPTYNPNDYNFPAQAPGGTLTGSSPATVTLTPCPLGVAGTDTNHYLDISGGTGTAEIVLITGGSCTSGANSGTIGFTPANSHSGAWIIQSATSGIQEAILAATNPGAIYIPKGTYNIYATITVPASKQVAIRGDGVTATALYLQFASGDGVVYDATTYGFVDFRDLRFDPQVTRTSGYDFHLKAAVFGQVSNLYDRNTLNAYEFENCNSIHVLQLAVQNYTGVGYFLNSSSTPTSGGFYSKLQATGGGSSAQALLAQASSGHAFAGTTLSDLSFQSGQNLITLYPNGGSLNEFLFENLILDSWNTRGIYLQGGSGSGNGIAFHGMRTGSSLGGSGGFAYVYSNWSNVLFDTITGGGSGEGFVLLGPKNVAIENANIVGDGSASGSNIALDIRVDGSTAADSIRVANSNLGFAENGATSGQTSTIGIAIDSGAHTNVTFNGVRAYGSSSGLSGVGTGTTIFQNSQIQNTTQPSCSAVTRQSTWFTLSGSGTKDNYQVCAKDAANAYAWRTLY